MISNTVVALYIRVSTQEQASEGYSIDEQRERLVKYAEAQSWSVYRVYSDPGFSGGSLERPGLRSLILDVNAGKVNKVVVYKLDRLSRSQKDTLYLIEDVFLPASVDFNRLERFSVFISQRKKEPRVIINPRLPLLQYSLSDAQICPQSRFNLSGDNFLVRCVKVAL